MNNPNCDAVLRIGGSKRVKAASRTQSAPFWRRRLSPRVVVNRLEVTLKPGKTEIQSSALIA